MNLLPQPTDASLPDLTVGVFLVDLPRSAGAGNYPHRHSGQELMPLMVDSVVRHYPTARFALLTTPTTSLPAVRQPLEVFSRPLAEGPPLYGRMRHYIDFLEQAPDDRTYLFIETDMLMLAPLNFPTTGDWDVAIPYKSKGMWINSGMLLVRPFRKEAALTFLRKAFALYGERYLSHPSWAADQLAYRDALGLQLPISTPSVFLIDSARVLTIPRSEFVLSSPLLSWIRPPPTWLLHFTAGRKKGMPLFFWLHMGPGEPIGRVFRWFGGVRW